MDQSVKISGSEIRTNSEQKWKKLILGVEYNNFHKGWLSRANKKVSDWLDRTWREQAGVFYWSRPEKRWRLVFLSRGVLSYFIFSDWLSLNDSSANGGSSTSSNDHNYNYNSSSLNQCKFRPPWGEWLFIRPRGCCKPSPSPQSHSLNARLPHRLPSPLSPPFSMFRQPPPPPWSSGKTFWQCKFWGQTKPGILHWSCWFPLCDWDLPTPLPTPLLSHPSHHLHSLNLTIPATHLGNREAECEGNGSQWEHCWKQHASFFTKLGSKLSPILLGRAHFLKWLQPR